MQGEYAVDFAFDETVLLQMDYARASAQCSGADKVVIVVEDTPTRVVLQHILVDASSGHVTKHCAKTGSTKLRSASSSAPTRHGRCAQSRPPTPAAHGYSAFAKSATRRATAAPGAGHTPATWVQPSA